MIVEAPHIERVNSGILKIKDVVSDEGKKYSGLAISMFNDDARDIGSMKKYWEKVKKVMKKSEEKHRWDKPLKLNYQGNSYNFIQCNELEGDMYIAYLEDLIDLNL